MIDSPSESQSYPVSLNNLLQYENEFKLHADLSQNYILTNNLTTQEVILYIIIFITSFLGFL